MDAHREVERKFLVAALPPGVAWDDARDLRQGYLALDGDTEVRLRFEPDGASLTVKHGGGLARLEEAVALDARQAEALWPLTAGRQIEKLRRRTGYDGVVIELDEYRGALAGLLVAEVEFADEESARRFVPPPWFGDEVTEDPRYKNRSLACEGRPPGVAHGVQA